MSGAKKVRVTLSHWDLLAIYEGLNLLKESGRAESVSLAALMRRIEESNS